MPSSFSGTHWLQGGSARGSFLKCLWGASCDLCTSWAACHQDGFEIAAEEWKPPGHLSLTARFSFGIPFLISEKWVPCCYLWPRMLGGARAIHILLPCIFKQASCLPVAGVRCDSKGRAALCWFVSACSWLFRFGSCKLDDAWRCAPAWSGNRTCRIIIAEIWSDVVLSMTVRRQSNPHRNRDGEDRYVLLPEIKAVWWDVSACIESIDTWVLLLCLGPSFFNVARGQHMMRDRKTKTRRNSTMVPATK